MKSVTEFPGFKLVKGLQAKAALAAEGKSPEEIQASLGESFKLEGDKLTHFNNALGVAEQNQENLCRVIVVQLNDGENAPAKATKVDDFHYVPEFLIEARKKVATKADITQANKGNKGKGRGKRD